MNFEHRASRLRTAGLVVPLIALFGVLPCAPVAGQANTSDVVRRLERQLRELDANYRLAIPEDQPIEERLLLDVGGSVRFGFLSVDSAGGTSRFLRQTDAVMSIRAELDGAHRFYGRARLLYEDFNGGDSFDGDGDELDEPILDRYWYQFDLRGARLAETGQRIDHNINVKAGRQFVQWGAGLALSDVLYAGIVDVEYGDVVVRALAGLTPSTGTIDFDGSRPGFDSDTDRWFFGGMVEHRGTATHRPYFSFLAQRDENERDFATLSTPFGNAPTEFDYDSEYWAIGSRGSIGPQLAYKIEAVYETGSGRSNSFDAAGMPMAQTTEDIEAWAGVAGLTYLLRDERDTRFEMEFAVGSGDEDRLDSSDTFGGNRSGTDDESFNGLGYVNTGLALAPEISNLLMLRLGASTSPTTSGLRDDRLRLGVNAFLFAKTDQSAPINVSTTDATFVGGELDFAVDWRIASDVNASMRYGIFLPGDAMPANQDDPRHFFYAGLTYSF